MLDLLQHRIRQTLAKVSPAINSNGMRLECATPAAVTMFVAPGPTDEVATMIWRRRTVFA